MGWLTLMFMGSNTGGGAPVIPSFFLLETGDVLLLETGDKLLLES